MNAPTSSFSFSIGTTSERAYAAKFDGCNYSRIASLCVSFVCRSVEDMNHRFAPYHPRDSIILLGAKW